MEHHYFATCALGWAKADTRDDAIHKLVEQFSDTLKGIVTRGLKEGQLNAYLWSCRVMAPIETDYPIEFFEPRDVTCEEGVHHHLLNVRKGGCGYTSELKMCVEHEGDQ